MEELPKIAKAYYIASSVHQKKLARDFFKAMDGDGDGHINQKEFIEFMSNMEFMNNQRHDHMTILSFFKQLDLDGNGILDFGEVMTLYYILKSGRPFCDKCNMFILNTYFMCVGCFEDEDGALIHLCLECYIAQKSYHTHDGLSRYVDNHSLLEATLKSKLNTARSRASSMNDQASTKDQVPNRPPTAHPQNVVQPEYHTTYIQNNYSFHHTSPNPVRTLVVANANVPERQGWKVALEALNTALNIGVTANSLCSIL